MKLAFAPKSLTVYVIDDKNGEDIYIGYLVKDLRGNWQFSMYKDYTVDAAELEEILNLMKELK